MRLVIVTATQSRLQVSDLLSGLDRRGAGYGAHDGVAAGGLQWACSGGRHEWGAGRCGEENNDISPSRRAEWHGSASLWAWIPRNIRRGVFGGLTEQMAEQMTNGVELEGAIRNNLGVLGCGV